MSAPICGEDSSSLASKCMAFCQALASQGQVFTFSLSTGPNFSFSLDTRSKAVKAQGDKKKASPSTLRRNAKRRAEFLAKKQQSSPSRTPSGEIAAKTPEKERLPEASHCELQLSPTLGLREELSEQEGASSPAGQRSKEDSTPTTCPGRPCEDPSHTRHISVCDLTLQPYGRGPKCGKTFMCEHEFRFHVHEVHGTCNGDKFWTRCPWPECPKQI